jgi:hypothetical protein
VPVRQEEFAIAPEIRFEIEPRPADLGGGWRLRLFDGDVEMGGGVFPPEQGVEDATEADKQAHADAMEEGTAWVASRR